MCNVPVIELLRGGFFTHMCCSITYFDYAHFAHIPQIWLLVYAYRMPYNGVYMKKNDTRIPPQSIESEQAVLGAIMMRPGSLYDIDDIMTLELFLCRQASSHI